MICYNQDWLSFEYLISELSCAVSFEGKLKEPELFSDSWIEYLVLVLTSPFWDGMLLVEADCEEIFVLGFFFS